MIYVAVDFSLNSPGICIHDDSKDSYHFVSYIKRGQGTKKDQKKQEDISLLKDTTLVYQPDWDKSDNYSSAEISKVKRYSRTAQDLIDIILKITKTKDNYIIGFEGTSFGSKMGTNNIIDMAAGAALLKAEMLNQLDVKALETVAPSTIKKHAGKGNMNKTMLWKVFIDNNIKDQKLATSKLFNYCVDEIGEVSKIPKPFDDLVDAFFLNSLLQTLFNPQA